MAATYRRHKACTLAATAERTHLFIGPKKTLTGHNVIKRARSNTVIRYRENRNCFLNTTDSNEASVCSHN